MHALLARQLRRHLGPHVAIPPEWASLLDAVTVAYQQADDDRAMLEHSLDTVSREMLERYHRLERQKTLHASLLAEKRRGESLALLNAVQIAALRATTPSEAIVDVLDQVATLSGAVGGVAWVPTRAGWTITATWPGSDSASRALFAEWSAVPRSEAWIDAFALPPAAARLRRIDTGRDSIERALLVLVVDPTRDDLLGDAICQLLSAQLGASLREKRIEHAMQASAELLRAITEGTQDAICAKGRDGRYLACNGAAARMLGIDADAALGHADAELFPGDVAERESAEDRTVMERGEPMVTEYRRVTAEGERFLLARKAPLRAVDGAISGVVSIISDVTARVLLEQRLRQSERMESLGLMAGGIAHEFNNLLTIITGNSSLLGTQALHADQRDDALAEIRDATRRAASITRQLLTISRHEVVRPTLLDVCATFRAREPVIRHVLGETIACAFLLPDEALHVRLDPMQLEQVLLNLALNARRSLPNGGTVSIEVSRVVLDVPDATARGVVAGAFVAIAVRDDGPGLDEAARARVFEPFFLAQPPTQGGGLGMALVYGAITAAGGAVWVESAPGRGTAYALLVPLILDPRASTVSSSTPMSPDQTDATRAATILLVEDERALREMARLILSRAGYQVLEARHGEDALAVVHRTPGAIDLLLTDVVMPAMGGGELSRQFAALRPGVPILFMSGYSDDEIVRSGVARADRHFLSKPFAVEELLQAVRHALGRTADRADHPPADRTTG